ncbi:unnamed protein product [Linum trigynum]|uniref:Gnk2-homologous domain-containing protein n=1 Tax=Linum trigynum TaxID=586398 RepID=A0AAV2CLE0_9ROSI
MATVLLSSLILTMINGCFDGGVTISAEAALDPMCAASNQWFCSPTDLGISGAQEAVLSLLLTTVECKPMYNNHHSPRQLVALAYMYSSCANGPTSCDDCLTRATQKMRENCPGKDGAQYGTEECCARYEKNKFCGRPE